MTYEERKAQVKSYLGKTVFVEMDRPIGSVHPKHPGLIYPINYGFIPGVTGGDGEELDVYVLGVDEPVKTFTGRVIGIIHRDDDDEDKLVAAPEGCVYDQSQIAQAVMFQEQFHVSHVESLRRKSCGAVVYRRTDNGNEYLLLFQKRSRTWSFPKGHAEMFETEAQTARREIAEETGLTVRFDDGFRETVEYRISPLVDKQVVLFLACADREPEIRREEIDRYIWASPEEAKKLMYEQYTSVIDRAEETIKA